jgi:hypothetical protein
MAGEQFFLDYINSSVSDNEGADAGTWNKYVDATNYRRFYE